MRLQLLGGAQSARGIIANAQRCVNLYPERNPQGSPVPFTYSQRPGWRKVTQGPVAAPVRGLYEASNGQDFAVIGQTVYTVAGDGSWDLAPIGQLTAVSNNPVSMTDNRSQVLLVDGSATGYTITLGSNAFAPLVDPTGLFNGADRVDYLDTFVLSNVINSNQFVSSLSNELTYDPTYVAATTGGANTLKSLIVNHRYLYLLGTEKTEMWYDAGNPGFPFAEFAGVYFEQGCLAPYSVAAQDISVYWLGRNRQGVGMVFRLRGAQVERVSNHALEYAIRQARLAHHIEDAIGYTYQLDGHVFYVLVFPSADQTWVFDEATQEWHQSVWQDPAGVWHRDRTNCFALLQSELVVGDWENGSLYILDPTKYDDDGVLIPRVRGFPHLEVIAEAGAQPQPTDGNVFRITRFMADMECGTSTDAGPQVGLTWSSDRGRTQGTTVLVSAGDPANPDRYVTQPTWQGTVGRARDLVFEVSWSYRGEVALNGAWVQGSVEIV
jgi:hypothetical protein